LEINPRRRRVIGSIKAGERRTRKEMAAQLWSEIEVGKKYTGTVKSLTSYGAFVDIGGVDGMVHVSELSWRRIKNPAEVVKVGDVIDVFVIGLDPEKHKISLGYKTAEMNPWNQFTAKYSVGDVAKVKIVKMMTFGAFAEIVPGVDGLIHISQIADRRIGKPEDVLSVGQEVDAKIIDIDAENKRISLSIRALLEPTVEEQAQALAEEAAEAVEAE
ncbi:MAG: S1 RNA-binding domain-containing protein, partial [Oscillospiraceae bacterium]|nr:S1 RNA-binding domain-containing protein [Oscillospiraceae bacterium]